MRLAFVSDIHGNAEALDAVLQDIKGRNIDKTYILGDLCFRGPEPKRALDLVRETNTEVIKGNADEWVVRGIRTGEVPDEAYSIMNKECDWSYAKLAEEDLDYLKNLPEELNLAFGKVSIHAFHATPESLFEVVQPTESDEVLSEKLMAREADIHIYAHIHKSYIRYIDGKCLINTGSVGLPFYRLNMASYAIVDIKENSYECSIVRVKYNTEKVIEQLNSFDYPNTEFIANVLT
ncbi:metallophosphoesterase family protein [Oceanobacillus timonensis]|uniref:metallophosphoesterase family protein n=1 Tax=Oceanobacillus timonensis TaxID=1926285 RepID=UPI0009B94514|nr:metallophosphoesterase family protein [Oceanobacillus timonensis]